jgi:hypothetical protein
MKRCMQLLAICSSVAMTCLGVAQVNAAPHDWRSVAMTQGASDSNMRWAYNHIERNIDMLQHDQHDYNGNRARAVSLFEQARDEITSGLKYDNGREDVPPTAGTVRPDADMVYMVGQCASDSNLNVVRRNIERIMDVLQHDNSDYGGHRVSALSLLTQGRTALKDAIQWDDAH